MRRRVVAVMAMLAFAVVLVSDAFGATAQLSGNVTAGGTPDTTKITVTSPGQIQATIQWPTQSAVLTLSFTDPTGKQVALDATTHNPKTLTYNATLTGTYKVMVKAKSGSSSFTGSVNYPGVSVPTWAGTVGGGTSGHAEIYPSGLDVGPDGTVYVADTGNDQVKAYNASGGVLWTAGTRGTRALGNFSNPRDIAYLDGKLYVDDTGNNRVQVLNATDGSLASTTAWPLGTSSLGITAGKDANGNNIILVSEDTQNRIAIFNTSGTPLCTLSVPAAGSPTPKAAQPRDAATNAAGNIYVAAYQQDQIDEFGAVNGSTCPSSTPIRTWGGHGTGNTQLIRPYGVAVNAATGNVYVADSDNERIQQFTGTGTYVATYGGNANAGGTFSQLRRVALNPTTGAVYGADLWDFHIDEFTSPTLTPVKVFGNVPPKAGFFNEPSGITFDSTGNLYVADSVNQRMQVFSPGATGATWSFASTFGARGWGNGDLSGFNWPRDISFAPGSSTLWVADTKNNRLLQFTTSGTSAGNSVIIGGALTWPYAVDASTNKLIVADTFANKVESRNPDGSANWSDTTANGVAFKNPYDVTVSNGTVYVADAGNKRIVELDATTGNYVGSIVNSTYIHSPQGVAVDPTSGSVWVADTGFNKVVQFTSTGQFVQAFGGAGTGTKQFNHPAHLDVHVDSTGHAYLYVTDVYNDRIQIFDLNE